MKTYYKHKIENLVNVNKIITIHYFEFGKNFKSQGETHDFWELVYADKGDIFCTADGKEFLLKQGEIFFHKPDQYHTLSANGITAPNVFIISFECKNAAMRFFEDKKITLDKSYLKFVYLLIEEGKSTFNLRHTNPDTKKMELLKKPSLGGQQLIKNYLEILLINLLRSEAEKENPETVFLFKEEFDSRIAKTVIRFLKSKVYEEVSIADICEQLSYNKSYIFKLFKKETGATIMQYFTQLKIEKAKQLLREGNMNVTQISDALAFDTPNYFTKTFKRITSLTPMQYKKMHER